MKKFLLIICAAVLRWLVGKMDRLKVMTLTILPLTILPLINGCGSQIETVPPLPGTLPSILTAPEKVDTDIYFDATVSMRGFTTLAADNVYLTLPDLLGDLCSATGDVKFYSFGEQIHELDGRSYRQFTTPEVYNEAITGPRRAFSLVDYHHGFI